MDKAPADVGLPVENLGLPVQDPPEDLGLPVQVPPGQDSLMADRRCLACSSSPRVRLLVRLGRRLAAAL